MQTGFFSRTKRSLGVVVLDLLSNAVAHIPTLVIVIPEIFTSHWSIFSQSEIEFYGMPTPGP